MISVVVPTLNSEATLGRCLTALVPAAVDGIVCQVVIADGGSTDATCRIAEDAGADLVPGPAGRGMQIRTGIAATRAPWLLVLHSDTVLDDGWTDDAQRFMAAVDLGERPAAAAAFRFALDTGGVIPGLLETGVGLRNRLAALPYGDQGLLIPRRLHDEIGGYRPLPLMEDVDIVRRLGRRRIARLSSRAVTSARRYRKDGYLRRIVRNQLCLAMYACGMPMERILRVYDATGPWHGVDPAKADRSHGEAAGSGSTTPSKP